MSEETTTTTPEATPATSAETVNTDKPVEQTIPKSRFDQVNKAKQDAEAELAKLRKAQEDAEKAKLQEQGRIQELYEAEQKKATQLEQRLNELQTTIRRNSIKSAVEAEARKANFAAPEDAYLFLDLDSIETDDNGNPKGVDKLVADLAKSKSYLLGQKQVQPGNGAGPRPAAPAGTGFADDKARLQQQRWSRNQF